MKLAEVPTFPSTFPCQHGGTFVYTGATMRMYFAGLAMQGLLANPKEYSVQELVDFAVRNADALIAKLEKESK